ncbi:ABC transporter substrate-binding protein [Cryobacterium sp. Hh7]|uniref:ABC transporter substrate-binding protein n=1 Tax=Cryobacterium sp. Hh7 TaxID=1259159 RepID=UPI00106CC0FC|nr:ABC transporter substrate-binding protein [Cryobacterium sp. Hh7]TFD59710.1 ABC transporter substrate-binding protein [Cryobacterium sp. Hh7]
MTKHVKAGRTAKKLVGTLALLVSFGLAATGCTSASAPNPTTGAASDGTPQSGGSLTVLLDGGFSGGYATGLDPATSNTIGANLSQNSAIFGGLFVLNSDEDGQNGRIDPNQAESFEFSEDSLTLTMKLRDGITFSDGTPVNADAVVWNWIRDLNSNSTSTPTNIVLNRDLQPEIGDELRASIIGALPENYDPAKVERELGAIRALDDLTVEVNFSAINATFINGLPGTNLNWIASPTAFEKLGAAEFKVSPVGAGPFTVVSTALSQKLVLERNPSYFMEGLPYLDGLTFQTTTGDQVAYQTLLAGQADVIEGLSTVSLAETAKTNADLVVTEAPMTSPYVVQLNTRIAPFDNLKAREAVYYATDWDAINQGVFKGAGEPSQSFTASAGLFYEPEVPGYRAFDLDKAKALVEEMGGLTVVLGTTNTGVAPVVNTALQTQWQEAGIEVELKNQALGDVISTFISGDWDAMLQTAGAWDPSTGIGVGVRFGSTSPFSGTALPAGATNAQDALAQQLTTPLDDLLADAIGTLDEEKRNTLYQEIAKYISDEALAPFGFAFSDAQVVRKGVHGPGLTTKIPALAVRMGVLYDQVWVEG